MIVSGSVDVWGLSKSSDAEGNMTFANLAEGMYLVVQTDGNSSVMVSPMLISVPFADQEQGWMYDVQAYPKNHHCPVCGDDPTITELIDYEQAVCELKH